MKYRVYDIDYDTCISDAPLPQELVLEFTEEETGFMNISDLLSDKISEETGYCHFGFRYEVLDGSSPLEEAKPVLEPVKTAEGKHTTQQLEETLTLALVTALKGRLKETERAIETALVLMNHLRVNNRD